MLYKPVREGITHINAYSKSRTQLGRLLSNYAHTPFTIDGDSFQSVEGYWYWLINQDHPDKDQLKKLWGWKAKEFGRSLSAQDWKHTPQFQEKICNAILCKMRDNPRVRQLYLENDLPITHYYVYGDKPVVPRYGEWLWDYLNSNELRTACQLM